MPLLLESGDRLLLEHGDALNVEADGAGPVTVTGVASSTITATSEAVGTVVLPRFDMPARVHTPDDHTATAGTVVNDCTTNTGWANFLHSGEQIGATVVETVDGHTAVTQSIQVGPGNPGPFDPYWRLNLPADVTVDANTRLVVEVYWEAQNGFTPSAALLGPYFSVKVASAVDLGGGVVSAPFPAYPQQSFNPVEIPLGGLTTIRSMAVVKDRGSFEGVAGASAKFWIREIRFANETPADRALEASAPSAVMIGPAYQPTVAQDPRPLTSDEVTVDLRPGHVYISRLNGVRHLREWGVPEDGETDVTAHIARALNELAVGETLIFPAGGVFRVERPVPIRDRRNVTIDCNGSHFYWTTFRGGNNNVSDNVFPFTDCRAVTFKNANLWGWRDRTYTGSALHNDAGAPTVDGTTKTLDTEGEAVRSENGQRFFMRHLLHQFTPTVRAMVVADDPGFWRGCVFTATLSDTSQAADDCVFELVARDDGQVLASRVLTLTATPTVYVLAHDPLDIHRPFNVRVRKATTAVNTVAVHELTVHGFIGYDINHDSASAVVVGGHSRDILFDNVRVEGATSDAFDVSSATVRGVTLRRCVSRGACRQGMSFNQGHDYLIEDFEVGECGRSAIDIEPYQASWFIRGVTIRNGRIWNATNYAFACNNWTQISNMHIDNVQLDGAGIGLIIGGGVDSSMTNIRSDPGPDTGTGKYAVFRGRRMRVAGVNHRGYLVLGDTPEGQADNIASDIQVREGDIIIRESWSATNVRGAAI